MRFNELVKKILESSQQNNLLLDVIFEDAAPRLATFVATHNVTDSDISIAFRKNNIKNNNDFFSNKEINKHIEHLKQHRITRDGKILCCWPDFYNYFEQQVKLNSVNIDNLFLDFDMEISKDLQSHIHPLSQQHGMQSFDKHKQQIQDFRTQQQQQQQQQQPGMLYYHPSGQGVTEYLVDNASTLTSCINNIYIHCKSETNATIMIEILNNSGYVASRYKSNIGKQTGFIL